MIQPSPTVPHQAPPFWRDIHFIAFFGQVIFLLLVALVAGVLYANVTEKMRSLGMSPNVEFMKLTAGIEISPKPIPYTPSDSYWRAFLVGVVNTLLVSVSGITLATIVGVVIGVSQLSSNWLIAKLAQTYVAVFRNIPLLLQLFAWYFAVFQQLPPVREAITLPGSIYVSNRGVAIPWAEFTTTSSIWFGIILVGLVISVGIWYWLKREQDETGQQRPRLLIATAVMLVSATLGWFVLSPHPLMLSIPEAQRFNIRGGATLPPEFAALLFGLVIYTGAFIAENVRAGILGISKGQKEAARALGLSAGQSMRLVILPQALRIIIPPTTNQYLNLAKNSSLAMAVAYADTFNIARTISNNTGQSIPIIALIMVSYLSISLITSLLMNLYNRSVRLVER